MATAPGYPSAVSRGLPHLGDDADRVRRGVWPHASYSSRRQRVGGSPPAPPQGHLPW